MALGFIFYWALFFILVILLILLFSTIRISVKELDIKNREFDEEKVDFDDLWKYLDIDFYVNISVYFLNVIKIFEYKLNKRKAKKLHIDEKVKKIKFKQVEEEVKLDFDKEILNKIKKINFKIKKFKLYLQIGTKSPVATSYLVAIISIVVSMILANLIKKVDPINHNYKITPLYVNKNKVNLNLNCIIYTKLVHIMFVIFIFLRKRRVKIYERASNRRIDDDSYGQYSRHGRRKYNNRRANTSI